MIIDIMASNWRICDFAKLKVLAVLVVAFSATTTAVPCVDGQNGCATCADATTCDACIVTTRYAYDGGCVTTCPLALGFYPFVNPANPAQRWCENDSSSSSRCLATDIIPQCVVDRCCDPVADTSILFEALCVKTCCQTFCTAPTVSPTMTPTRSAPSTSPTLSPSISTTLPPTRAPTTPPTTPPSSSTPTSSPTGLPTSSSPTTSPSTPSPTISPTASPTLSTPTAAPTTPPTNSPTTSLPTANPTSIPTSAPTCVADILPTCDADYCCSANNLNKTAYLYVCTNTCCGAPCSPTVAPTAPPSSSAPTSPPTPSPTSAPVTSTPTSSPTTSMPTSTPSFAPTASPVCTPDVDSFNCDDDRCCEPTPGATDLEISIYRYGVCGTTCCDKTCTPTSVPTTSSPTTTPSSAPTCSADLVVPATLCVSVKSRCCMVGPGDKLYSELCGQTCCGVTCAPTSAPTLGPTTSTPSATPTHSPSTSQPTVSPSTSNPTPSPTAMPSVSPTTSLPTTGSPSRTPTRQPTFTPTTSPTCDNALLDPNPSKCVVSELAHKCCLDDEFDQTAYRTVICRHACCSVTCAPTSSPTAPSSAPTRSPLLTMYPTQFPTNLPTTPPTTSLPTTGTPSTKPTTAPTVSPSTSTPTTAPTTSQPTPFPTASPTTSFPTTTPSQQPSTSVPTKAPTTSQPTPFPTASPTTSLPTTTPSQQPSTSVPSLSPSVSSPTTSPVSSAPSHSPSVSPSHSPTLPNCNGVLEVAYCNLFHADNCTNLGLEDFCPVLCDTCPSTADTLPTTATVVATTASLSVTPTAVVACPSACGSVDKGAGTCDSTGACTSCNPAKILASGTYRGDYFGNCYTTLTCKNSKIVGTSLEKYPCDCEDNHCFHCVRTATGDNCRKCKDNYYLLDGVCVEDCPSTLTSLGVRTTARRCLPPFTCKRSRTIDQEFSYPCKCTTEANVKDDTCLTCEFEVGGHGQKCVRCADNKFLNVDTNVCEDDCANRPGSVEYSVGVYGSMCTDPFTCTDRTIVGSVDGDKCKCMKSLGSCVSCDWGMGDSGTTHMCTRCGNSEYLQLGSCVDTCAVGTPIGDQLEGRECQTL